MNLVTIDVGGTFIKHGIVINDKLTTSKKVPTPTSSLEYFLTTLDFIMNQYQDYEGIALSMPGYIDADKGFMNHGGALRYILNLNMKEVLENRYHQTVWIENDARCGALAELHAGSLKDIDHSMMMVLGTGVGGALIANGKLYKGSHLFAGELSYLINGSLSKLSLESCFGAQGSITSLMEKMAQALEMEDVEGPEIFEYVKQKDKRVMPIFMEYCQNMILQFYNIQAIYDPEVICIGGGISAQDVFIEALQSSLNEFYSRFPFPVPHARLVKAKFGNDANLWGAYYHFKSRI